jgi:endonuclease/exonuclease/phosphatase family metal-dependent hydrolase
MHAVKLVTANILAGGIGRSRRETRLAPILERLASLNAQVIAVQEALWWDEDDFERFHLAERVLGMRGVLGREASGMHTALFIAPPLVIRRSRVIDGAPWRHGAVHAEVTTPSGTELVLGCVHLSPRSPTQRVLEAEALATWWQPSGYTVVAGDYNSPDADLDVTGVRPYIRAELVLPGTGIIDTRATDHLVERGFVDLAARDGEERAATAGHGRDVANRCDRYMASPDAAAIAGKVEVIKTGDLELSDHDWLSVTLMLPEAKGHA